MSKHAKNIIEGAVGDVAGYVITGFPVIGVSSAIVKSVGTVLAPKLKYLLPSTYLDWQLKGWHGIYRNECALQVVYQHQNFLLPQVLMLDNTGGRFRMKDVRLIRRPEGFSLSKNILSRTAEAHDSYVRMLRHTFKKYHNDNNLRLCGFSATDGGATLECQNVMFEDSIRTNLVLDADFQGQGNTLRKELHNEHRLESLETSLLANQCGVNILVFTPNGELIIQMRSRSVAVRPGEYCPSGSGTIESSDVPSSAATLADANVLREAHEEIGVWTPEEDSVTLLGITRELIRGGQPEFFFAAKDSRNKDQVLAGARIARDRFERKSLLHFFDFGPFAFARTLDDEGRTMFRSLVDKCIDKYQDRMSIPLWTALTLWKAARLSRTKLFNG